jgi:NAD(P)-dependent dehydrogenase (short-subunit alcohol dehydrogenase family)
MRPLEEKVAFVTGAARGLGWGIARALGQAGAAVCVTDINGDELARAESDLEADGTPVINWLLDCADRSAFHQAVAEVVNQWGRLDIMVHNAIYMPLVRFDEMSPEVWQRQIDVSLGGLYNATHAVWSVMKAKGGGHILGVASGSSLRGYVDEVAYCANKHAQEGFLKALALESAPFNIAVNSIGPGRLVKPTRITWSELDALPESEKAGWADPVELGQAWVWLASQPPNRFSGLRFDAGPIVDSIQAEGWNFPFEPEKVTMYVDDFVARQEWHEENKIAVSW